MLQALESRVLFTATLSAEELQVAGTSSADHIAVGLQTGVIYVDVNGHRDWFSQSNVLHITIRGMGGADRIDASASPVPVLLDGGSGNDKLIGGRFGDSLLGGSGNDQLSGGDGDDYLQGGSGNDRLDGGAGDDSIHGSAGNDSLLGGDGSDYLSGGKGNDNIDAGLSARNPTDQHPETLLGGDGNDILNSMNNFCGDEIDGGAGQDLAYYEAPVGSSGPADLLFNVEKSVVFEI